MHHRAAFPIAHTASMDGQGAASTRAAHYPGSSHTTVCFGMATVNVYGVVDDVDIAVDVNIDIRATATERWRHCC